MSFQELLRRLLIWVGCMLLIVVGIPLYFISQTNNPTFDAIATIVFIAAAPIVLFVYFARRHRQLRRYLRDNHICLTCGYDLRATPTRCPECGHSVTQ